MVEIEQKRSDDTLEPLVNLQKLTDLVDLYYYAPMRRTIHRNESKNLEKVLSYRNAPHEALPGEPDGISGDLVQLLALLSVKIHEKFKTMADAYRHFDVNFNSKVSFNEFLKGIDDLNIKY